MLLEKAIPRPRALPLAILLVFSDNGCVRLGFDDGATEAPADGAWSEGSEDGQVDGQLDGATRDGPDVDGPVVDGAAKPEGPKTDLQPDGGGVPGNWVSIAKGTFTMGSPTSEPCRETDEDLHQVTLTHNFEMQDTEVTQGQFSAVMGYAPSSGCNDCPVGKITWHEAAAYCNALSARTGKATCYSCSGTGKSVTCQEAAAHSGQKVYACPGYRLPTDAEWEYAYRAGTKTPYYNGANDGGKCITCSQVDTNADKIGWYCANAGGKTHPVRQKQKNPWGLFDMAGNVWEWCHDWYQHGLGTSAVTDPWGPATGTTRVVRGASWYDNAFTIRAANRNAKTPTVRYNNFGVRCYRTIP